MSNIKRWLFVLTGVSLAAFLIVGLLVVAPALAQGPGGMMGGGMMWSDNNPFFATEPLSITEATEAVETYLAGLNNDTFFNLLYPNERNKFRTP